MRKQVSVKTGDFELLTSEGSITFDNPKTIDWSKVKTIEDVVTILKHLNIQIFDIEQCPELKPYMETENGAGE